LVFSLETRLVDGAKHEWRDGDQSLEAQLPDIISLLQLAGPILTERRRQHEEAEKQTKSANDDFTIKDRSLADWLNWAREHVAGSDPMLMGAERIFQDIGQVDSWTYRD
jgi:hypothetical protein